MSRSEFHNRAYFILCWLIAFLLPAYIYFVPPLIVLLSINWIVEGKYHEKFSRLKSNKFVVVFISLYLFYLVGMLWTENKNAGWFDLQVKLSLLIFPLVFGSLPKEVFPSVKKILNGFIAGCFTGALICFCLAVIHLVKTGENHFFYTDFSYTLHPSYFSMYLLFSIAILLHSFYSNSQITAKGKILNALLVLFFLVTIVLLEAKIGILILILMLFFFALFLLVKQKKYFSFVLTILFSGGIIFFMFHFFPSTLARINITLGVINSTETIDKTSIESNRARILAWEACAEVIKKNILFGVGTGDAKDILLDEYKTEGMTGILGKELNAHNQFLQTFIAIGAIGFLLLLFNFILPMREAVKQKKYIYLLFLIIVTLNFLVESMLETQAGVMFYAFFNSLLLFSQEEKT